MQCKTGSYVGTGIPHGITWVTEPLFTPDVVIIKADDSQYAVWRSSAMPAFQTAAFTANATLFANGITAFIANGFQIGTHATVNANGITYHWTAFYDNGAGDMDVGSYTGNGVDDRNLDIVGFQPTILWIMGDYGTRAVWRVDENAGDSSMYFHFVQNNPNLIQTFRPLGFQIGNPFIVNLTDATFYYVAFRDAAGFIETGTYAGNGIDDRNINVGFEPDMVFVKGEDQGLYGTLRIDTMPSGQSGRFDPDALVPDRIQAFAANVFQVGTNADVNTPSVDYYWAAWQSGSSYATTTTTSTLSTTSTSTLSTTSTTTTSTLSTTLTTTTLLCAPEIIGTAPILRIRDRDTIINLLKRDKQSGYRLCGWTPRIADYKRGGIWQDSPIAEGRRLAQRRFGNVAEVMNLTMSGHKLETLIRESQDIRRLMEKASNYWWTDWQNDPVWIEARASCETNVRYAILHRGKILQDPNPYSQPFMERHYGRTAARDLNLVLERGHWQNLPPECSASVLASARECYGGRCYGNVDLAQALQPVADHVYVANKRNEANITHIFRYDAAPPGFSGNLVGTAPFNLLPAVPAIGDMVYFGIQNTPPDWGYFSSLVFDLENAQFDITGIVWEFWDGGAWDSIVISKDNTESWFSVPLSKTGINSVVWELDSDFKTATVNGVSGAWVRARVTSVGGAPTSPRQQNRDVYTVTWPYLEVDANQVGGDIVALARYEMVSAGGEADDVIVGLRSLSRGADFSAYLNCGGHQNPPGVSVVASGNCSVVAWGAEAPARYVVQYSWGADGKFEIQIAPSVASQYYGVYHVYMRGYRAGAGVKEATTFNVSFEQGSGKVVQQILTGLSFTPYARFELVDLGRLELSPPSLLDSGEEYDENKIVVDVSGTVNVTFYDFILIPVDEWAGRFVDLEQGASSTNRLQPGRLLEFESVKHPKQQIRANLWGRNTDRIVGHWDKQTNGPVILQANADQRLWALASLIDVDLDTVISRPEILTWFSVGAVQRYLSMRGDR